VKNVNSISERQKVLIEASDPNTPAVQATAFGLVGLAVVTTFPIRKYLGDELLGSKNGMKFIRN
jgi:hypothetical protein